MSTRLLSWLHCTAFPLIMAKHFVVIVVNRTDLNAPVPNIVVSL